MMDPSDDPINPIYNWNIRALWIFIDNMMKQGDEAMNVLVLKYLYFHKILCMYENHDMSRSYCADTESSASAGNCTWI